MNDKEAREVLVGSLLSFRSKVNEHPRLRILLKGWDRSIRIDCDNAAARYRVQFKDTCVQEVVEDSSDAEVDITLRAPHATLLDVFEGRSNPATLFLNGELQVFATEKDQVKLDAISLLLWD
jgi:putative sterol carrier protein